MKLLGNKKSKRQKTSLKYNIQKRVREHRRRLKKEAKKSGVFKKNVKKDPGIPNSWPFKAELLAELEAKKERKDAEMEKRREKAKADAKRDFRREAKEKAENLEERDKARKAKRADDVERSQVEALRRIVHRAEILLQVLDARDPLGCRSPAFEAWAQQNNKRVVFVLTKGDLISPQVAAEWIKLFGQEAPAIVVQAEAGREGVKELLQLLGVAGEKPPTVGIVGYPGTGKRILNKAMRAEVKGGTPWLLDNVGRLRPASEAPDTARALHSAIRGVFPLKKGAQPVDEAGASAAVITQLLQRAPAQSLMRRLRLQEFEGPDGFFAAYAGDRGMKNKKGHKDSLPNKQVIAHAALVNIVQQPGCFCSPPSPPQVGASQLWAAHGAGKPTAETFMTAQHGVLSAREAGPTAGALAVSSAGFGPAIGADSFAAAEEGDDDGVEEEDSNEEGSGDEEMEGEESEEMEGEESEEESDEGMDAGK